MVKVTLQANRNKGGEVPSTFAVTKQIIKENGIGSRGLNRGLSATIGRNGVFNMLYFGFYHSVKNIVPEYQDPYKEFLRKVAIGFASGTLGSVINIPFDVAKSRIQGPQPHLGVVKYRSTFPTIATVYREEGFKALYKGLTPKVMRVSSTFLKFSTIFWVFFLPVGTWRRNHDDCLRVCLRSSRQLHRLSHKNRIYRKFYYQLSQKLPKIFK